MSFITAASSLYKHGRYSGLQQSAEKATRGLSIDLSECDIKLFLKFCIVVSSAYSFAYIIEFKSTEYEID
jgi:hypothetical protein